MPTPSRHDPAVGAGSGRSCARRERGYTVIELLLTVGIIGVLAALSVVTYFDAIERARVSRAIADIRTIEKQLMAYEVDGKGLPMTLDEAGWAADDPWGRPYMYLNIVGQGPGAIKDAGEKGKPGLARRDKFLVPINSSFDLYSMGPDGKSKPSLNAKDSWDDVVRAADGAFVGLASEF